MCEGKENLIVCLRRAGGCILCVHEERELHCICEEVGAALLVREDTVVNRSVYQAIVVSVSIIRN